MLRAMPDTNSNGDLLLGDSVPSRAEFVLVNIYLMSYSL